MKLRDAQTTGNWKEKFLKKGGQRERERESSKYVYKVLLIFYMNFELCLHGEHSKELVEGYSWKAEEAE